MKGQSSLTVTRVGLMGLALYVAMFHWTVYRSSWHDHCPEDPVLRRKFAVSSTKNQSNVSTARRVKLKPTVWIPYSPRPLRVPYPIFMTSLPKSGTTSMFKYFQCGEQAASHNWVTREGEKEPGTAGACIENNIQRGQPPFEGCGRYDVYTDTGYLRYDHDQGERCFFPSIDGLEEIYESYPNATFVNVIREKSAWYQSLKQWSHSSLFVRFRLCNATHFPNGQSNRQDFLDFYDWHNNLVRAFVRHHPSLTYIEVSLESNETGRILQQRTGINSSCWGNCRPDDVDCYLK